MSNPDQGGQQNKGGQQDQKPGQQQQNPGQGGQQQGDPKPGRRNSRSHRHETCAAMSMHYGSLF